VEPYLDKLKTGRLDRHQKDIIKVLDYNLRELTSPFSKVLSSNLMGLTPREVQAANLVKIGKSTKEIAEIMNLSSGTISVHRKNIRKKLGLTNRKSNLRTVLSSIVDE